PGWAGSGMSRGAALVTLAIGRRFSERWRTLCQPSWQRYAERHGYDVICIEHTLDSSERARDRSPAWQKCLILGQPFARDYERLVWVYSATLINPAPPPA